MSRVAKKPIALPKGVEFNIQSDNVSVKGPKGTLSIAKPNGIEVKVEDGNAQLSANDDSLVPLAGTLRAILANLVKGVARVEDVRQIEIEDLLSRDPVAPDPKLLSVCIRGKAVMVSGAGGSMSKETTRRPSFSSISELRSGSIHALPPMIARRAFSVSR